MRENVGSVIAHQPVFDGVLDFIQRTASKVQPLDSPFAFPNSCCRVLSSTRKCKQGDAVLNLFAPLTCHNLALVAFFLPGGDLGISTEQNSVLERAGDGDGHRLIPPTPLWSRYRE